jgi:hypothetical protein
MADTTYTDAKSAYDDQEAIRTRVDNRKDRWKNGREVFLRAAYRNILFYRGLQWIKWDRGMGRWRSAKLPHNTPTPVTNVFASTMDALISVFARIEPQLNFRPGLPDEPDDRASADVAVRAMNVVEDEVNIRLWRQVLATWVGLSGMAWLETGYDPSPQWGTRFIPSQQCPMCGQVQQAQPPCQTCGNEMMEPAEDPMTGEPIGETYPIGRMYVDVVPLFEMFFDASIPVWSRQREWLREKSVTVEDSKARWPSIADKIQPNVTETTPAYAEQLPMTGPPIDENQTGRLGLSMRGQNTRVTERWYWSLPDATYPDGLLAVIVGQDLIAYAGPLPYSAPPEDEGQSPKYFLPAVCFPQKLVPGSGYAKTVADDLAPKQAQRNRWESMLEACGFRMGAPVWLKPNGANITNMTGDPGNIISYNAVGPNAAKPERIPGQPIPMSMIEMIHDIDKSFEELAATFDVIKGARPEGVSAGIALQILQERNLSRYGPLFILWEQSWAEWARQALEIFRQFATEPRLLRIRGRDGKWQVEKFLGADLQGSIDIIPEAASSLPRSSLLDKAEMEQLAAMHVIDLNDPEIKYKFLEIYGRTNLTPTMALDTKNAIMENEAFEQLAQQQAMTAASPDDLKAAQNPAMTYPMLQDFFLQTYQIRIPEVRPAIDDHSIHAREMRAKCKSESFRAWPQIVQIVAEKHAEYHQQLLIQQQQALQGPQMPQGGFMGAPSPMRGASGPAAMKGQAEELAQTVANGGQHNVT